MDLKRDGQTFTVVFDKGDTEQDRAAARSAMTLMCVGDAKFLEDGSVEAFVARGVTISDVIGMLTCARQAQQVGVVDTRPL